MGTSSLSCERAVARHRQHTGVRTGRGASTQEIDHQAPDADAPTIVSAWRVLLQLHGWLLRVEAVRPHPWCSFIRRPYPVLSNECFDKTCGSHHLRFASALEASATQQALLRSAPNRSNPQETKDLQGWIDFGSCRPRLAPSPLAARRA